MDNFWKRLFGWICGFLIIVALPIFGVGLETGEGFFGVIDNIASKVEFDPFASIKEKAYEKGIATGKRLGFNDAYQEGRSYGYSEGYYEGYSEGKNAVLDEIEKNGETFDDGYEYGLEVGYESGYEDGFAEGKKASKSSGTQQKTETPAVNYILNKNTKKFHYTWCSSVNDMKASNRWDFTGTRAEVIAKGYVPCKRCNP